MENQRFKFRVWDIEDCAYFDPRDFDALWLNENAELRVGFYSDATQMIEDYTDNVIIEQCTGLKDKNGNLIYEGDIIHEVDKEADIDDVSQIVWNQGTCHFMKLDLPETGLDRYCILCEDDSPYIEIIGNIHEQPEQKDGK